MKRDLFTYLRKLLPFLGIILLIIIILFLDVNKIIDSFLSIDPKFIIIALSLTLPKILLYGISWKVLLNEQRIKLSYIQTVKIYLIGVFYGSFTPGFLGHLIRAPYIKEKILQQILY